MYKKFNGTIYLDSNCIYKKDTKELFVGEENISLTKNEQKFIEFLVEYKNITNTSVEIFTYINFENAYKEYSPDSVKALVKRLRKKLPKGLIQYSKQKGYNLNFADTSTTH